jgi:Tfp pilus assembly protein PilW
MQLRKPFQSPSTALGLSLVELMVAMVAGLIVAGAAVALIVAILKSNAQTLRATRLTQELRTTAEVIARDLRRSRSVTDPIANVGAGTLLKDCNSVVPATGTGTTATCATFGYDCNANSAGALTTGTFKAIGLAGGKVRIASSAIAIPACPTATTGVQVSSDTITITGLNFTALTTPADGYTVQLTGRFTNDPSATPLTRSITQEVRIRSAAVN